MVDPWAAAPLVDVNPLYRRYFLKKWSASLRKKQKAFPHLYDFEDMLGVMDEWALDILSKRMSDEEMNRKVAPRGTCDSVERIMSIHSIRSTVCGLDFRLPEHYREVVFDSLRPDGKRYRGDRIHRHL